MKKFLLGVMMAASIAGTAQASIKANQDMDMLFNATPVTAQVEQLSTQEMKATQGEWIWFVQYFYYWALPATTAVTWAGANTPTVGRSWYQTRNWFSSWW